MKKYFIKETSEEVKFGDTIVLDLVNDAPKGHVQHHHLECKFLPQLVQLLLNENIIEEREVQGAKTPSSKKPVPETKDNLQEDIMSLASKVDALEQMVKRLGLLLAYNPKPTSAHGSKPRRNASKAH